MQNSGKTITTHASLLPQGFPIFLHFNHVWVLRDHALSARKAVHLGFDSHLKALFHPFN